MSPRAHIALRAAALAVIVALQVWPRAPRTPIVVAAAPTGALAAIAP